MNIAFVILGILLIYLAFIARYVPKPWNWVIEKNLPKKPTQPFVWQPGIHFLWIPIKPFYFVRNKLFCADKSIELTIGVDDGNPGGSSNVEFKDVSAAVATQIVLKVIDPKKATYDIDDYEKAAVERTESNFRRLLATMDLDEAMTNVDKRNEVTSKVFKDVNEAIKRWGVELTNPNNEITIIDFILDDKTIAQRDRLLEADKNAKVITITAEAERQATVLKAQGIAQGEWLKIKTIAEELKITIEQVIVYLLTGRLFDALQSSTVIATSEGGTLNAPVNVAATMASIQSAMKGGQK